MQWCSLRVSEVPDPEDGEVAVEVELWGYAGTIFLAPADARELARQLRAAADLADEA